MSILKKMFAVYNCTLCGCKTKNETLCDNCKNNTIAHAYSLNNHTQNMLDQITNGFKTIDPYLSRYGIILDNYYELQKLININNDISISYTENEILGAAKEVVTDYIDLKLKIATEMMQLDGNPKTLSKEVKKCYSEVVKVQINNPRFHSMLEDIKIQLLEKYQFLESSKN